jgi:hypothetical protein
MLYHVLIPNQMDISPIQINNIAQSKIPDEIMATDHKAHLQMEILF